MGLEKQVEIMNKKYQYDGTSLLGTAKVSRKNNTEKEGFQGTFRVTGLDLFPPLFNYESNKISLFLFLNFESKNDTVYEY